MSNGKQIFIEKLKLCPRDMPSFSAIIAQGLTSGYIDKLALANRFHISVVSIDNWISGKTAISTQAQTLVINWVIEQVKA